MSRTTFALFRIALGLYLAVHFAMLVPYAGEVFSREGMLPDAALNPTARVFPSLLAAVDTPAGAQVFVAALAGLSLLLAGGVWRRAVAVVLWYGWACLFNRNILIANPGLPYVGWLLLASALVPAGEGMALFRAADPLWRMPRTLWYGAWALLALGYSISGFHKMTSPSWIDGTAMMHLLSNPLARDNVLRELMLALPPAVLALMSWSVLALEAGFVLFCMHPKARLAAWLAMVGMHLGIILVVDFADLTVGMLMVHLFTLDARWLEWGRGWLEGRAPAAGVRARSDGARADTLLVAEAQRSGGRR